MVLYIIGLGLGDEKDITVRYVRTTNGCPAARARGMQCIGTWSAGVTRPQHAQDVDEEISERGDVPTTELHCHRFDSWNKRAVTSHIVVYHRSSC